MADSMVNQKIIMVTGKGGVGKSTYAAALAQKKAREGLNTLLVELGEQSYFQYVYGRPIGYEPVEISANFSICLWGGESCLREYVYHLIKVKKIVDLFFDNKVMRTFIKAAPALKELAILGKITSGIRAWGPALAYDVIVVDAFATGHFLALLRAPMGMGELIEAGPMGEQSRRIDQVLRNKENCAYHVITLPEELPVTEAEELVLDLRKLMQQESQVFCNRVYQSPLGLEELAALAEPSGGQANPFAVFLVNLVSRQASQSERLRINIPSMKTLPLILNPNGREVIDELEKSLS